MRIARIIEYFPPHIGGMERHGLILSQEQIKLGNEVEVYIGVGSDKLLPRIYKMPLQFLPLYNKARRLWFNVWAYFTVKNNHKKNPYDIIHLHGDFVEAFFGGKLAKKLNIPAVLTIHAGLNKKFLKPKNAKYFDNIKKIICVSQEIAGDLKNIGVADDKLEIISSGIYLVEFSAKGGSAFGGKKENGGGDAIKNNYSAPIIISVGVLRKSKGQVYLIEAFNKLKNSFSSATLLLIGDGPDKIELEKQANDTSGIYFLGRQEHNDIIKYLQVSDIFVSSSANAPNDREGTPTVIMEAMAAGLPVVATKVGGNPILIKDGINGFLTESGDSFAIAAAIDKILSDEELRQKIKERNLEDIKQKDWPVIAKKITDVYFCK